MTGRDAARGMVVGLLEWTVVVWPVVVWTVVVWAVVVVAEDDRATAENDGRDGGGAIA